MLYNCCSIHPSIWIGIKSSNKTIRKTNGGFPSLFYIFVSAKICYCFKPHVEFIVRSAFVLFSSKQNGEKKKNCIRR